MLAKYLILFFLSLGFSTAYATDLSKVSNTPAKGTVALTFDDGPTVEFTPQILAILKKYNIKATFFMVGESAKAHPEIVKMVMADGHAIANHSMTHPMLTKLDNAKLEWEVNEPSVVINDIVGVKPVCLRYPFGASNSHVRDVIRANGMLPTPVSRYSASSPEKVPVLLNQAMVRPTSSKDMKTKFRCPMRVTIIPLKNTANR